MKDLNLTSPLHLSYMHFFLALAFILFLTPLHSRSQNLVPNPSFEDTVYCPTGLNELSGAQGWTSFGFSPDFFHTCGPSGMAPPSTVLSYQVPHSGGAYAGLVTYVVPGPPGGPNWHEIIGAPLWGPLIIGDRYYLSLYISYANDNNGFGIASNNLGVKLSTVPFTSNTPPAFDGITVLNANQILNDSINWTFLYGSFIADSNYQYIMIGNFFDDNLTDTVNLSQFPTAAYYFIDDVCLSTDSSYCLTWTSLNNIYPHDNVVFPNPFIYYINLRLNNPNIIRIEINNAVNHNIEFEVKRDNELYKIFFNEFIPSGLYYLRIFYNEYIISRKIIKN